MKITLSNTAREIGKNLYFSDKGEYGRFVWKTEKGEKKFDLDFESYKEKGQTIRFTWKGRFVAEYDYEKGTLAFSPENYRGLMIIKVPETVIGKIRKIIDVERPGW